MSNDDGFAHHRRLERALRLAAASVPSKPLNHFSSSSAPSKPNLNRQTKNNNNNNFATSTFTKHKSPWRKTTTQKTTLAKLPTATTATFAAFDEGGGARRLALTPAPLLAEERHPTNIQPRRPRNHLQPASKSVHFSDHELESSDLDAKIARLERQLLRASVSDDEDSRREYTVYPSWWGHEEHVPSTSTRGRRKTKQKQVETGSRPVETVKPAKSYAPVKMVEKATGTGDEYTSDEDVSEEDDTESDQDVQQPRRGRRWIRKEEHPSVSNWKFPKHQIDECIQVNLDAEPVPQKQRTRTTTTFTLIRLLLLSFSAISFPKGKTRNIPTH